MVRPMAMDEGGLLEGGPAFDWYEAWAQRAPEDVAVVTPETRVTYEGLAERIHAERVRLTRSGLRCGDRIEHAAHPGSVAWMVRLIAALDLRLQVVLPDQDWPVDAIADHTRPLLEQEPADHTPTAHQGGVWLFTSGTTERPKPRFRSLDLLRSDVARVLSRMPAEVRADRPAGLCLLPLSHGFGLINGLLLVHAIGGTVLIDEIDRRDRIKRLLREFPVAILYSWPAHLAALSNEELWRNAKAPLRWCVSSSLHLPAGGRERFAAAAGCPVRQQYGATETGPLCIDSEPSPSPDTRCMGTPVDGVSFRVIGPAGESLADGQEGELAVRLEHLSLNRDELDAEGYWRTGDRGYRDRAGRIHVLGRYRAFTDERRFAAQGE